MQGCPTFLFGGPDEQFLKWSRAGLPISIKHKIKAVVTVGLPTFYVEQVMLMLISLVYRSVKSGIVFVCISGPSIHLFQQ